MRETPLFMHKYINMHNIIYLNFIYKQPPSGTFFWKTKVFIDKYYFNKKKIEKKERTNNQSQQQQ